MTTLSNTALAEKIKSLLLPEQVELFREVTSIELVSAPSYEHLVRFMKAAASFTPEQAAAFSSLLVNLSTGAAEPPPSSFPPQPRQLQHAG